MSKLFNASIIILLFSGVLISQNNVFVLGHAGNDGPSTLYSVNQLTGVYSTIGPVGFERCGSLEIDQNTGIAYSACERLDGSNTPVLVRINLTTGAGTEIGPTGISGAITDLAFSPSGILYVYDGSNNPTHSLFTVNTTTGAATLVNDINLSFTGGNGIVFIGNTLYHSSFNGCNIINTTTAQATPTGSLTGFDLEGSRVAAMDINPLNNIVYAIIKAGEGSGPTVLAVIDPTNCTITDVIATDLPTSFDGLAFPQVSGAVIPTMQTWGLIILCLCIFIGYVITYRSIEQTVG